MTTGGPPAPHGRRADREEPILITPAMLARRDRESRIDFEKGMRAVPPLTLGLILVNVLVFVWEVSSGALDNEASLLAAGALAHERVFAGELWRLFTAPFLHAGWDHLIGNCIVLYILGMACEHALGAARTALVYGLSGLSGSYLSVLVNPGPSVGASGAVFGLTASVIVVLYKHQDAFYIRDKRIGFVLLVWGAYQVATGLLTPYIDNFAHIGGILGGALTATYLKPRLLRGRQTG